MRNGHYEPINCPQPDQCSAQTTPPQSVGCKCASIVQANLKNHHANYVDAEYIMEACPSQTAWYYFEGLVGGPGAEVTLQIERAVTMPLTPHGPYGWTGFNATLNRSAYTWPNKVAPAAKYHAGADGTEMTRGVSA